MRPVMLTVSTRRFSYAHEQNAQWEQSMGMATMANKRMLFVTLVDRTKQLETHSNGYVYELLRCLRCRNLAILDRPITLPLAQGNYPAHMHDGKVINLSVVATKITKSQHLGI